MRILESLMGESGKFYLDIAQILQWIRDCKKFSAIHRIEIYPVDSVIRPSNNRGLIFRWLIQPTIYLLTWLINIPLQLSLQLSWILWTTITIYNMSLRLCIQNPVGNGRTRTVFVGGNIRGTKPHYIYQPSLWDSLRLVHGREAPIFHVIRFWR